AKLAALTNRSGTVLDVPINLATNQFVSSAPNASRLMVIVSDGRVSPVENANATIAAARSAENQGIRIVALAFYTGGTNVDTGTNLMRQIPSFPHDYSFVASTATIQSNFNGVAD